MDLVLVKMLNDTIIPDALEDTNHIIWIDGNEVIIDRDALPGNAAWWYEAGLWVPEGNVTIYPVPAYKLIRVYKRRPALLNKRGKLIRDPYKEEEKDDDDNRM